MRKSALTIFSLTLLAAYPLAQVNAGHQPSSTDLPFTVTKVTDLRLPWRIAFLPDGRMLITEKVGAVALVSQDGTKLPVKNVPPVLAQGQGGMLGVFLSPHYASDHFVYLTYSEPGDPGQSSLALARAKLSIASGSPLDFRTGPASSAAASSSVPRSHALL